MALGASSKAAQEFVPLKEVRDGILVLKDNTLRGIVMSSSINFALKSEDNQTAIITQFQDFLNSLDFSIEIFIQSRRLDIKPYLNLLEERYNAQTSDLMRVQTREYIGFIKSFTDNANIMTKTFFIVIPFSPGAANVQKNPLSALGGFGKRTPEDMAANFEDSKIQLAQRIAVVEQGLIRCGLRTVRLGSEEIIELFYKLFNPGETDKPMPLGG